MVDIDKFKDVIARLEDEDGSRARRRDVVESLTVLVRTTRSKIIVEVGSSGGYISLWLALAATSSGGKLYLFDDDANRIEKTKSLLDEVGLDNVEYIASLPSEKNIPSNIDFVVLDHDLPQHLEFYKTLFPEIMEGGTIVTDNAIAGFADLRGYINEVRLGGQSSSVMFPLGEGLEVSTKSRVDDPLNTLYTDLIR